MSDTTARPHAWDSLPPEQGQEDNVDFSQFVDDYEELPRPVNWELLSTEDLEAAWLELNVWVDWLRHTYGLPATIIPPYWHRHPELVWELSALHIHWLGTYQPEQHAAAPLGWHRDFADARERLRDWTAACGTRLDHDQPTRQTRWPGEDASRHESAADQLAIVNRGEDFAQFVRDQVAARRAASAQAPSRGVSDRG